MLRESSCKWACSRPHTGAWIETPRWSYPQTSATRRPHTGAWIETRHTRPGWRRHRGRPHTGAWIETGPRSPTIRKPPVAPTRGRGSKLASPRQPAGMSASPPHGGVDRNHTVPSPRRECPRRPHTGAWIETILFHRRGANVRVAPTRGRGSKHPGQGDAPGFPRVAPTRGRGSKQPGTSCPQNPRVAPTRGRGSKLAQGPPSVCAANVAPTRGRGSKHVGVAGRNLGFHVAPTRGRGSKRSAVGLSA